MQLLPTAYQVEKTLLKLYELLINSRSTPKLQEPDCVNLHEVPSALVHLLPNLLSINKKKNVLFPISSLIIIPEFMQIQLIMAKKTMYNQISIYLNSINWEIRSCNY